MTSDQQFARAHQLVDLTAASIMQALDALIRELPESVPADYAIERLAVTLNAMPDKPGGGRVLHFKALDRLTRVRP